ncbi:hypothetical protein OA107_01480 [Candidatus Pelagibacter sp.]|nr:hypothetical protein [Candidatus Pelagibacter sp.]
MTDHIIFITYLFIFIFSIIGYGFIFSKLFKNEFINLNIGYQCLLGFFFLSFISLFTSFFFPHNFTHNFILHLIGLSSFVIFFLNQKRFEELKNFIILFLMILIGVYVFKNHDDFPYYHLSYALNLSENGYAVGLGNFSHGFRTFSTLFYIHSLFYMPLIEFYLFHIGPFLIILFFNYIVLFELQKNFKKNRIDFLHYFTLLCFIFVNVIFYRLGEHGTDRSSQILLLLIFTFFFKIFLYDKNSKKITTNLYLLIITILLAASIKVIYYLYFILIPILFFKKNIFENLNLKKNYLIIGFVSFFLFINLTTSYLNTGCLIYPAEKTCFGNKEWSIPNDEVKGLSIHYEWWAKGGGGPNYKVDMDPKEYIKNFNWLNNWVDRHFFNKVSDSLLGIITISVFLLVVLNIFSKKNKLKNKHNLLISKKSLFVIYAVPIIFLIEWFLNHPAMRYGGFVLFALPIFIFTARILDKINISKDIVYRITVFFYNFNIYCIQF